MNSLIPHWSKSSLSSFLGNPLNFKKNYVLGIFDDKSSVTAMVGKAAHKALEHYYKGMDEASAIAQGLEYLHKTTDMAIEYGKTGTRQAMLNTYGQAIKFYLEEAPTPYKILGVEESITTDVKRIDGEMLPLPLKAIVDLVTENNLDEIELVDHKFVYAFTNPDELDFGKWLQAMFCYHVIVAKYGKVPARMIYRECKTSKNKDGSAQISEYIIEFGGQGFEGELATFYTLVEAATRQLNLPGIQFLPNPGDMFNGNNSFELFRQGIIDIDAPVERMHRTTVKEYVDKKYVPSQLDRAENANLTNEEKIRLKLQEFNMVVDMQETHVGASVTQYTFKPSRGIPMAKLAKMGDDIALALGAESVRIEAPIRGTSLVGVEIPSAVRQKIDLAANHLQKGTFNIPIGVDVYGKVHYKDITDAPHMLIAGSTGSGKSVMINTLINSLTKQLTDKQLELVLIDPKRVELAHFEQLPHVKRPIAYEVDDARVILEELVAEMEERYKTLMQAGVRSIVDYKGAMTRKVVIVDEFADLMHSGGQTSTKAVKAEITEESFGFGTKTKSKFKKEIEPEKPSVESLIVRLAQKARAVGIHVVLATQRPSADVVTGLIKANIPTKIAFATSTAVNSRVILDENGAEELTGKGDMLFQDSSTNKLVRLQGLYS